VREQAFGSAVPVDKHPPHAKWRGCTDVVAHPDQTTLAGEDSRLEVSALFRGGCALDRLQQRRKRTSVIVKVLGAIDHLDAGALHN
jgi:hypothetical protein